MKRALLVIDVQNEYFMGERTITYPAGSLGKILSAVDAANDKGIMVIYIQHTNAAENAKAFIKGSFGWQIHEKLLERKYDCIIEKKLPGSFTGTELDMLLRDKKIETVTICGYMTQMCCDTTSRQAKHLRYSVEFLSDATATHDFSNYAGSITAEELHKAILTVQASSFSKVLSTDEWMISL